MTVGADKRRRNTRPSKYRPRTEAQKTRRKVLWEARAEERLARGATAEMDQLLARQGELETLLRDQGRAGVHGRRNARPLDEIVDDAERLGVLRARVERLEALGSIERRKRETRGKIIIGGALLAELIDGAAAGHSALLSAVLDILDRRVQTVRDRAAVRDLLGGAPLPARQGAGLEETIETALQARVQQVPDFDAMVHEAMAEETLFRPSEIDPDYAELDDTWRLQA